MYNKDKSKTGKCWTEGRDSGVNNSSTGPEPTNKKLSGNHYEKMDQTQFVDYMNKKRNQLTS